MELVVGALDVPDGGGMSDALLAAAAQDTPDDDPLDGLVRRVLLAMLEERRTRRLDTRRGRGVLTDALTVTASSSWTASADAFARTGTWPVYRR